MDYRQRIYQGYLAHLASAREISLAAFERQRPVLRAHVGRFLPKDRAAEILDIGCGYGGFLYFLQHEGYTRASGVDINPELLEMARGFGVQNVQCADVPVFLEEHPEAFDAVVGLDVVEHFPKESTLPLLDAVYRALKRGGTFVMQSPNADGPFGGRYRYGDFSHTLAFTRNSVRQVLSVAGFQEIEVYPVEPAVHGVVSLGRYLLWKGIKAALLFYLTVETGSPRGHILTQNLIAVGKKAATTRALP